MQLDRLKAIAGSLPGTTLHVQWGDNLVAKIGGKIYFIASCDGALATDFSLKVSADDFAELPESSDAFRPAPYLARASWVQTTDPDIWGEAELRRRMTESYRLVRATLSKKAQAALPPAP